MRVLVVLPQPPLREGGAAARCSIGLLRGLSAHGVDVTCLAARQVFTPSGAPPPGLAVEVVDVTPRPPWRARAEGLLWPRSDLRRSELQRAVEAIAAEFDVVHLDEVDTAWVGERLGAKSVLHVHYRAFLDRQRRLPLDKPGRERLEFVRAEHRAIGRHRHLVANSAVVAETMRRANRAASVTVMPLSLDPADYPPAPLSDRVVGLIGTGTWPPTADATETLVAQLWPMIRRKVPEAELLVAGRGTDRLGLAGPALEVLGAVPETVPFLHRLGVLAFPLRRGSGMKVKVLEAMACGVPVVTTTAGAEGIGAVPGVFVEDRHAAAADVIGHLLHDAEARREAGAAARRSFHERFAPSVATAPLVSLYETITS